MDAREREKSQSRRASIKRPWEEVTVSSDPPRLWHGAPLPPIDAVPFNRAAVSREAEPEDSPQDRYQTNLMGGATAKRARYEGREHDYNLLSRENLDLNGKLLQAQATRKSRNHQDSL